MGDTRGQGARADGKPASRAAVGGPGVGVMRMYMHTRWHVSCGMVHAHEHAHDIGHADAYVHACRRAYGMRAGACDMNMACIHVHGMHMAC